MSYDTFTTMILKARDADGLARLQHIVSVAPEGAESVFACLGQSEWGGIDSVTLSGNELTIDFWCQEHISPLDETLAAPVIPSLDVVVIADYTHFATIDCLFVSADGVQRHEFEFCVDGTLGYTHTELLDGTWAQVSERDMDSDQAVARGSELHPMFGERIQNLSDFIFGTHN